MLEYILEEKQKEMLEILSDNLLSHLKMIMEKSGIKLTDDEVSNLFSKIGVFVLQKALRRGVK